MTSQDHIPIPVNPSRHSLHWPYLYIARNAPIRFANSTAKKVTISSASLVAPTISKDGCVLFHLFRMIY